LGSEKAKSVQKSNAKVEETEGMSREGGGGRRKSAQFAQVALTREGEE